MSANSYKSCAIAVAVNNALAEWEESDGIPEQEVQNFTQTTKLYMLFDVLSKYFRESVGTSGYNLERLGYSREHLEDALSNAQHDVASWVGMVNGEVMHQLSVAERNSSAHSTVVPRLSDDDDEPTNPRISVPDLVLPKEWIPG